MSPSKPSRRSRAARASWIVAGGVALICGAGVADEAPPTLVTRVDRGLRITGFDELTAMDGRLYFTATSVGADGYMYGRELMATDGTPAGTAVVRDIFDSGGSSDPHQLTNVSGTLYFHATDASDYDGHSGIFTPPHGTELWRSDGTEAGTRLVADIRPGRESSTPYFLVAARGTVYFTANDGTHGTELWSSTGGNYVISVTHLVYDVPSDASGSSTPAQVTDVNGTLFFEVRYGASGRELWKTQDTIFPPSADLVRSMASDSISEMVNASGTLVFATGGPSGGGLWKSDGTTDGTVRLASFDGAVFGLTAVAGATFFVASDGVNGYELWRSDGTPEGTAMVKDIHPGNGESSIPAILGGRGPLLNVGGTVFFAADDGTHGLELWRSNGTQAGATMVADINPGAASSSPDYLTDVAGTLHFAADDGTHGHELWRSNGTPTGTNLVVDILAGDPGSGPRSLTAVDGALYFVATEGNYEEGLWKLPAAAPETGSVGSVLEVHGDDFGEETGEVELEVGDAKAPGTTRLRILEWSDTLIRGTVRSALAGTGVYDVTVRPVHGPPQVLASSFQLVAPTILGVSPDPVSEPWISRQRIALTVRAFGTARGKVTASWTVEGRTITRRCKVLSWPRAIDGGSVDAATVRVRLPRRFLWSPDARLTLTNKLGSAVWSAETE